MSEVVCLVFGCIVVVFKIVNVYVVLVEVVVWGKVEVVYYFVYLKFIFDMVFFSMLFI